MLRMYARRFSLAEREREREELEFLRDFSSKLGSTIFGTPCIGETHAAACMRAYVRAERNSDASDAA